MARIIALSAYKGSGKDTVADYLVSGYGYTKKSFAAKLKDLVSETYRVPREDLDHPEKKEMPLHNLPVISTDSFTESIHTMLRQELKSGYWTPRALCILEGSIKRAVYSNHWVQSIAVQIMADPLGSYVISDLRYKSEVDTLRILLPNVEIVRISRFSTVETQDPSERNLDDFQFDKVISNMGTLDELYNAVELSLNPGSYYK